MPSITNNVASFQVGWNNGSTFAGDVTYKLDFGGLRFASPWGGGFGLNGSKYFEMTMPGGWSSGAGQPAYDGKLKVT